MYHFVDSSSIYNIIIIIDAFIKCWYPGKTTCSKTPEWFKYSHIIDSNTFIIVTPLTTEVVGVLEKPKALLFTKKSPCVYYSQ